MLTNSKIQIFKATDGFDWDSDNKPELIGEYDCRVFKKQGFTETSTGQVINYDTVAMVEALNFESASYALIGDWYYKITDIQEVQGLIEPEGSSLKLIKFKPKNVQN